MTTAKFIIVGQIPPPHHGSNIMTEILLRSVRLLQIDYFHVNKQFSIAPSEVEKYRPVKIFRILKVVADVVKTIIREKPGFMFYLLSTKKLSLLPDFFILSLSKLLGLHTILYIHGVGHKKNYSNLFFKLIYNFVLGKKCSIVILDNRLRYDISHLSRNIFILPNCLESVPEIETKPIKQDNSGKFNIIFVSNVYRAKGLLCLLKALGPIVKDNPQIHLTVIGGFVDDNFKKEVFNFIESSNLSENVNFLGFIYGEEKQKLLNESDLFVFPSHNEAFPLVLLEAMANGLPVIASDVGAIPSMIEDNVNGFIVKSEDEKTLSQKIDFLSKNRTFCRNMGKRGRAAFLNKYTFEIYLKRLESILQKIAAKQNS